MNCGGADLQVGELALEVEHGEVVQIQVRFASNLLPVQQRAVHQRLRNCLSRLIKQKTKQNKKQEK
jgi:hypothetical protein